LSKIHLLKLMHLEVMH